MFSTPGARILKFLISRALATVERRGKEDEESEGADRWNRTSMASRGIPRITIPPMAIPYFAVDIAGYRYIFICEHKCVCICVCVLECLSMSLFTCFIVSLSII